MDGCNSCRIISHCTFRLPTKGNDLKKLYEISDIVLEGNFNFSHAVSIADIALIDAKSGSSCEVPYLNHDLPVIYLSPRSKLKKFFTDDIFGFGEFTNNPSELENLVDRTFKNDKFLNIRRSKIEYYFGPSDGRCAERAADVLIAEM